MARFCEKHMARAIETLFSKKTGTEYDLCNVCLSELEEILQGNTNEGEEIGRKRTPGRPKANKG